MYQTLSATQINPFSLFWTDITALCSFIEIDTFRAFLSQSKYTCFQGKVLFPPRLFANISRCKNLCIFQAFIFAVLRRAKKYTIKITSDKNIFLFVGNSFVILFDFHSTCQFLSHVNAMEIMQYNVFQNYTFDSWDIVF